MSFFNANLTDSGASGGASGLVTKFEKTVTISSAELAEIVVNLANDIDNYDNITNEQIIVELVSASAIAAGDATLSHTYNADTGDLTITTTNSNIPFASNSAVELEVIIYVAGSVQLPPTPEANYINLGELSNGKHNIITSVGVDLYEKLITDNFIFRAKTCSGSFRCDTGESKNKTVKTSPTLSYNASAGELTIVGLSRTETGDNQWHEVSCSMTVEVLCFPTMVF